jgi:hypothetical protein
VKLTVRSGFALLLASLVAVQPASAGGLHLGMKLSAKKYGQAWNSGSQGAAMGRVTGDFASVLGRVPPDVWADMPRGGGGQVLGSSKGKGSGTLTVATSQGVVTLIMAGKGFNWRVADIIKAGDDGRPVSTKTYLDASLSAREFMIALRDQGAWGNPKIEGGFQAAFMALSPDDQMRIRGRIPPIENSGKPHLTFNGGWATMIVNRHDGGQITFQLANVAGWRVADYAVNSPNLSIPSFKSALPAIAAADAFERFTDDVNAADPNAFAGGDLRATLNEVRAEGKFPVPKGAQPLRTEFSGDGRFVTITYPNRTIRLTVDHAGGRGELVAVDGTVNGKWESVGGMLALRNKAKQMNVAGMFRELNRMGTQLAGRPESVLASVRQDEPRGNATAGPRKLDLTPTPKSTPAVAAAKPTTDSVLSATSASEPVSSSGRPALASTVTSASAQETVDPRTTLDPVENARRVMAAASRSPTVATNNAAVTAPTAAGTTSAPAPATAGTVVAASGTSAPTREQWIQQPDGTLVPVSGVQQAGWQPTPVSRPTYSPQPTGVQRRGLFGRRR